MSLQWEPAWKTIIIEVDGIKLKVQKDEVTGLLACPICGLGEKATYFFSERDLIKHMISHKSRQSRHYIPKEVIIGEEEN